MYKMIVVEDEKNVREGLCEYIKNMPLNIEILNSFANGEDAIAFLKNNHCDIIYTDICMEKVTGLELAKYVYENMKNTKVVIISGYDKFDYAKEAMKYNVQDYLLKPLMLNEIEENLSKIIQLLDNEKKVEELIPIVEKDLFSRISQGILSDEKEILHQLQLINVDIDIKNSAVCILELTYETNHFKDEWTYGKEQKYTAIRNIFKMNPFDIQYFWLNATENAMAFLCIKNHCNEMQVFKREIIQNLKEVKYDMDDIFHIKILTENLTFYENFMHYVKLSYEKAKNQAETDSYEIVVNYAQVFIRRTFRRQQTISFAIFKEFYFNHFRVGLISL